jgi:hypothetical protein
VYQQRDFYRHARYVHGWLSAFAFIALFFFALTGLFLNNPDWFKPAPEEAPVKLQLPNTVSQQLLDQENPSTALLDYVRAHSTVVGRYKSRYR